MTRTLVNPLAEAKAIAPLVEELAVEAELAKTVPGAIVDQLRDRGLFHLMVPTEFGGLGEDIFSYVDVIEEISRQDASVGWSYMANTCSTALFSAYLGDDAVRALYASDTPAITAGMMAPAGRSKRVEGGYELSGKYSFASGSEHATWLGAGTTFERAGRPVALVHVIPKANAEFTDNWDVIGLVGTGSNDFVVDAEFASDDFTFERWGSSVRRGQPSLYLGFEPIGVTGHVAVALGTAKRAIQELVKIVDGGRQRPGVPPVREQQLFLNDFAHIEARYRSARALVIESLGESLDHIAAGNVIDEAHIQNIRRAASFGVETCANVVRSCYTWSGSAGLRNPSAMGRAARDMLAQTQHILIDSNTMTIAGSALLAQYR